MEGRVLEYAAEEETATIRVGGGSDSSRRGISNMKGEVIVGAVEEMWKRR